MNGGDEDVIHGDGIAGRGHRIGPVNLNVFQTVREIGRNQVKHLKTVFISTLILVLCCSCAGRKGAVEARRQKAIEDIQQYHLSSKNPVVAKSSGTVLFALQSASIVTLKKPTVAYAVLVEDRNKSFRLHVFWIEDHPSVDAVEFKYRKNLTPTVLPIPAMDLRYNESQSKRTVEFSTGYEWRAASGFAASVGQLNPRELEVRLFRKKNPVTPWIRVDFYEVDRWISDGPQKRLAP